MKKLNITEDDLRRLYIDEGKLQKEIAEIYGCVPDTIRTYLKKYNIPLRKEHPWAVEENKKNKKKYNKYNLSGEYGIGWTYNTGQEFYFDLEDFHLIKDICWMESDEGYIVGTCQMYPKPKIVKMHNMVTNCPYVDHIYHKKYDNRRSQLRRANDLLNARNRAPPSNNTSGIKGISWRKRNQKWRAYITVNHKRIELGEYENKEDAITARKKAEEKYYREWRYQDNEQKTGKHSENLEN